MDCSSGEGDDAPRRGRERCERVAEPRDDEEDDERRSFRAAGRSARDREADERDDPARDDAPRVGADCDVERREEEGPVEP